MRLYLIRHAKRGHGKKQDMLTKEGKKQSENLAKKLRTLKIDKVICGTSKRATETAKPFLKKFNGQIEFTGLVNEQSLGILKGKTKNEWRDAILKSKLLEEDFRPEKGENKKDVIDRVKKFIIKLKKENHENIAIFSHSGFISYLMIIFLNKNIEESKNFRTNFCSILSVELDKEFNVICYNIL